MRPGVLLLLVKSLHGELFCHLRARQAQIVLGGYLDEEPIIKYSRGDRSCITLAFGSIAKHQLRSVILLQYQLTLDYGSLQEAGHKCLANGHRNAIGQQTLKLAK